MLSVMSLQLTKKKHAKSFMRLLHVMPCDYEEYDLSRLTFAFFSISGLDMLNMLDEMSEDEKKHAVDWIYRLHVKGHGAYDGFQASTMIPDCIENRQRGHLAMTYTGLATLLVLGDDFSRIRPYRKSFAQALRHLQQPDGCFSAMTVGTESDMRFLYCACCVSFIVDDWDGVDKPKAIDYILQSIVSFSTEYTFTIPCYVLITFVLLINCSIIYIHIYFCWENLFTITSESPICNLLLKKRNSSITL